jgi:hypothetical protein
MVLSYTLVALRSVVIVAIKDGALRGRGILFSILSLSLRRANLVWKAPRRRGSSGLARQAAWHVSSCRSAYTLRAPVASARTRATKSPRHAPINIVPAAATPDRSCRAERQLNLDVNTVRAVGWRSSHRRRRTSGCCCRSFGSLPSAIRGTDGSEPHFGLNEARARAHTLCCTCACCAASALLLRRLKGSDVAQT